MVTWGEELPIDVLALVPFTRYLPNKPVLLSWDSISVMSYIIQQGGTKSIDLMKQVGDLFCLVILLMKFKANVMVARLSRMDKYSLTSGPPCTYMHGDIQGILSSSPPCTTTSYFAICPEFRRLRK